MGVFPRPSVKELKRKGWRKMISTEIGVLRGKNAKSMLDILDISKIYLIDPYLRHYEGYTFSEDLKEAEKTAHKRLSKYKDKTVWLKMLSDEAWEHIKEKMDFVYIDANHTYEYVKRDIEHHYPLLKEGGMLAGHDFSNFNGVRKAVNEFSKNTGLRVFTEEEDWWMYKGKS